MTMLFTPDRIDGLKPGQIFVFGSNLQGHHAGGAARIAHQKFGAVWGQGVGLQGQSYAIPTMQGGVETIKPYVDEFVRFAKAHEEYIFLVTRIGCGIAGFKDSEIAPLFSDAVECSNIILPREFAEVLCLPEATRRTLMKSAHGQVRTMADIIIALNKEKHYTTPAEALSDLQKYFERISETGDEVAFTAVRIFWNSIGDAFSDGRLDAERLCRTMEDFNLSDKDWNEAYLNHCLDKLLKIIIYFNDFRRYRNADTLLDDMQYTGVLSFSHCGPQREPYYFNMSRYPWLFFQCGLRENWDRMTTDGVLDGRKMSNVMFDTHERGIRKYGLDAVIGHDYVSDGPCHPEVYFPKKMGTAPVYVKTKREYIKSCGEGKGPNRVPDYFEMQYALPLLEKSPDYTNVNGFYIPKSDCSLPVYHEWRGKIKIPSHLTPRDFIDHIIKGTPIS